MTPRSLESRQQRPQCVTDPEVTEGPYCKCNHTLLGKDTNTATGVSGELIRSDVLENSKGVKLNLDINVIDVTTCKPIPNVYVELWGCNSTVGGQE